MTYSIPSLRKLPVTPAHSKCRARSRRPSFTRLEQLLLLSASPFAVLDQQVHVDESLSSEWDAHNFHDVSDFKHVSDYPTLLHHLKLLMDHDKATDQPSHSDDSLHHDDDTDADDDQWLGPDDNDLPKGTGFILDGDRDFSGTRGDHLEVAHDGNLELKEGVSAF